MLKCPSMKVTEICQYILKGYLAYQGDVNIYIFKVDLLKWGKASYLGITLQTNTFGKSQYPGICDNKELITPYLHVAGPHT